MEKKPKSKNYVNNKEFHEQMVLSFQNGELTPKALEMLMKMIDRIQAPFKYEYDGDREDVASGALLIVLEKWQTFDINRPELNPFSYFTSVILNGIRASFNELTKGRKDSISFTHIMSEDI